MSTRLVARTGADSATQPAPNRYSLSVYRGDSCAWRFILWLDADRTQEADLTGATATAQMRDVPDGVNVLDLSCTVTLPNIVDVSLLAADSALAVSGRWDLQLTYSDGSVATVVAGSVFVTADITQP